ncbi:MAG: NAD(P)/FAD-dependent oxidoreductase [Solirubrobacterales bacterium]|nr:NAD(P)/FAD-dependent oxidoreductase [Solirubrobacterales bacterium]
MTPNDRRPILCDMEGPLDPQLRPAASDELELVATGISALVAKRILETKGDAVSAPTAQTDPIPGATSDEPSPVASRTGPKPDTAPEAVIVGAGPAGLAAAAELGRRGVSALVLERGWSVATSWRGRYDRLRLNTSRWTSNLPHARYPRTAGLFPSRDDVVGYLEDYAARNRIQIRSGTIVERVERNAHHWTLTISGGQMTAAQLVIATGHQHTPLIPAWPGRERFNRRLLHSAEYRNPREFHGADVLVVGPGCSGMEIAYDLAEGGASRVRVAIRTQPNIILRQAGPVPGDVPATLMYRLPPQIGDRQTRLIRRLTIGDLSAQGLVPPKEGIMSRSHREGKAPAILDKPVIDAIKERHIEIVAAVDSLDATGVLLADGTRLEPDVVIAATGYTTGLEPLVGHLGVLDERGVPLIHGGPASAPGLRFIGYQPRPAQIGYVGAEATRAAKQIKRELTSSTTR